MNRKPFAAQQGSVVAKRAAEIAALQKHSAGNLAGIIQQSHFLQSGNVHDGLLRIVKMQQQYIIFRGDFLEGISEISAG